MASVVQPGVASNVEKGRREWKERERKYRAASSVWKFNGICISSEFKARPSSAFSSSPSSLDRRCNSLALWLPSVSVSRWEALTSLPLFYFFLRTEVNQAPLRLTQRKRVGKKKRKIAWPLCRVSGGSQIPTKSLPYICSPLFRVPRFARPTA